MELDNGVSLPHLSELPPTADHPRKRLKPDRSFPLLLEPGHLNQSTSCRLKLDKVLHFLLMAIFHPPYSVENAHRLMSKPCCLRQVLYFLLAESQSFVNPERFDEQTNSPLDFKPEELQGFDGELLVLPSLFFSSFLIDISPPVKNLQRFLLL